MIPLPTNVTSSVPVGARSTIVAYVPLDVLYNTSAVQIVLSVDTAEPAFADLRAVLKLGTAIAVIIEMMATTTNISSNENPRSLRISFFPSLFACTLNLLT